MFGRCCYLFQQFVLTTFVRAAVHLGSGSVFVARIDGSQTTTLDNPTRGQGLGFKKALVLQP